MGRCILPGVVHIVDDDASFRTAIERRLEKAGYQVATYPSAQHLLDRLPDEKGSGCILLDVRIPGLSGPDLQGRLGKLGSTLPIVFLTGYADVPTTVQAIKAGADDVLTKPVSSDQSPWRVGRPRLPHPLAKERCRAQALLWLAEGRAVEQVAELLQVSRQTVYNWLSDSRSARAST